MGAHVLVFSCLEWWERLTGQSLGSSPFPLSSLSCPPVHSLPSPQSPYALFPALARLFYTQIPMRRSSCPSECQVSPWDPSDSVQPRALTMVPALGAPRGRNPWRDGTCDAPSHVFPCMFPLAQFYRPLARPQNHLWGFKKKMCPSSSSA